MPQTIQLKQLPRNPPFVAMPVLPLPCRLPLAPLHLHNRRRLHLHHLLLLLPVASSTFPTAAYPTSRPQRRPLPPATRSMPSQGAPLPSRRAACAHSPADLMVCGTRPWWCSDSAVAARAFTSAAGARSTARCAVVNYVHAPACPHTCQHAAHCTATGHEQH
jgi:hypothetical protein